MILTREWLLENTKSGTINKEQATILRLSWPLERGWAFMLEGKQITEAEAKRFVDCKTGVKLSPHPQFPVHTRPRRSKIKRDK